MSREVDGNESRSKASISFNIPIKPKAKGRPRATRRGGLYTDKATREYEAAVRQTYIDLDLPKFEGNVQVTCIFQKDHTHVTIVNVKEESTLRADVDNLCKSLLDGLNGVAYDDDKQVVNLKGFKR
jgi:Holliday junction resolvase RusA-like endonuclease